MTDAQAKEFTLSLPLACPTCGGEGVIDSGGSTPWGSWIDIPCPSCRPDQGPSRMIRLMEQKKQELDSIYGRH